MNTAYLVCALATIVANAAAAFTDFVPARFVVANATELGVNTSFIPALGALKAAGACGLLLGVLGVPAVDVAASAGLVLFFCGAVGIHLRERVFHNIAPSIVYLALAGGTFALTLTN
ncbi:DoxX family protein [Saccharomonospora sp. NPDC006951]